MQDTKNNVVRYETIRVVITNQLKKLTTRAKEQELIFESNFEQVFNIDYDVLNSIVNDYFENLDKWKNHFKIKECLDRHKVGAILGHYIIKHKPIVTLKKKEYESIGVFIHVNYTCLYNIILSKLDINPEKLIVPTHLTSSILKSFATHSIGLKSKEPWSNIIIPFVEGLARDLCQLEYINNMEQKRIT